MTAKEKDREGTKFERPPVLSNMLSMVQVLKMKDQDGPVRRCLLVDGAAWQIHSTSVGLVICKEEDTKCLRSLFLLCEKIVFSQNP